LKQVGAPLAVGVSFQTTTRCGFVQVLEDIEIAFHDSLKAEVKPIS
jgi:hypothetical protein